MLTFDRQNIGDTFLTELNQALDCFQYQVKKADRIIGTVYSSATLTMIKLSDAILRIDRERRLFRKSHHKMYNHFTGKLVGTFEFPDWQSASHTRCILRFTDDTVYSFNQNNDQKRLLKPKTWNLFRFDMSNSENHISYYCTELLGEIDCNNEDILLPIAAGIFIIDEKFRIINEPN